jgi:acyl-CoA thioesterase
MIPSITPFMQAFWANDPAPLDLGISLIAAAGGKAELRLTIAQRHLNGHQTAHGGVLQLLADTAAGIAANSLGQTAVTQTNTITFLSPAKLGESLTAHSHVVIQTGRTMLADATITGTDGHVVAVLRSQLRQTGGTAAP